MLMQPLLQLTMTSLLSIILFSLVLAIFLLISLQNNKLLSNVKHELLLLCMLGPIIRLILPVEIIPWTRNINVTLLFPDVVHYFNKDFYQYKGQTICLWNIIIGILVFIATINTIKTMVEYVLFIRSQNANPIVEDNRVHLILDQILLDMGKKVSVTIRWTSEDNSPYVYGILKPTILLPKKEFSNSQLKCILRHEMAHYLHGDLIMRFIWCLIKSFCFWNPAVYVLDRQLEKILEIRADENALKKQSDDFFKSYLSAIVELSTQPVFEVSGFSSNFYKSTGLTARRRVEIILFRSKRKPTNFLVTSVGVAIPVIIIMLAMNCIILEPKGSVPDMYDAEVYEKAQDVTTENSFFVRNDNGTYDMYLDGIYITTLESTYGSDLLIYETLKEAFEHEETN